MPIAPVQGEPSLLFIFSASADSPILRGATLMPSSFCQRNPMLIGVDRPINDAGDSGVAIGGSVFGNLGPVGGHALVPGGRPVLFSAG